MKITARIAQTLVCAAVFMTAAAGAQEAPVDQAVSDEELYAATCINAGMLLKRFGVQEGTEEAALLDGALNFWLQRHTALEPDEASRRQQWVTAAQMIVETTGEDPEAIQPALVVLMANCQARRADILAVLADPESTN